MHQAGSVELLIMFADQCLNVNERTCTTSQSDPHTPLKPEQGKANRSFMTWRKLWGHNQAWVAETPSQDPGQTPCKSLSQKEPADPRQA